MVLKIKKFFLLIILTLLQSCSGGKIGNFFETSFKNIEEPKTKEVIKFNLNNKKIINSEENSEKNKNIEEPKTKEDIKNNLNNKKVINSEKKSKNYQNVNKKNISFKKKQYKPQSYKIIFILKDVDPKDPTEDLRTILRNSDVNFEIEKIERFFDLKDKSIKRN